MYNTDLASLTGLTSANYLSATTPTSSTFDPQVVDFYDWFRDPYVWESAVTNYVSAAALALTMALLQ